MVDIEKVKETIGHDDQIRAADVADKMGISKSSLKRAVEKAGYPNWQSFVWWVVKRTG